MEKDGLLRIFNEEDMTELEQLKNKVTQLHYPPTMLKINGEIEGVGFFPGATGMIGESQKVSDRAVMILGQDQDSEAGFKKSIAEGNECYSPTWKNLRKLLTSANIAEKDCFFTNSIMGVRKDTTSNSGQSPAFKHPVFIDSCLDFLIFQINIQRPKAILCLGEQPIKLLSQLFANFPFKYENFFTIDRKGLAVNKGVQIKGINDFVTTIVFLTHPSIRNGNANNRMYGTIIGANAEIEMLKAINKVEAPPKTVIQLIDELENVKTIDELRNLSQTVTLYKVRKKRETYPKLPFSIASAEIKALKVSGWIDEDNQLNIKKFATASTTERLLFSLIWKNGDLRKIAKIIDGIEGKVAGKNDFLTFIHFGNYLKNSTENIIVDQHVIRAYQIIKLINEGKQISNSKVIIDIRKKQTLKGKDEELIVAYKNWIRDNKLINSAIRKDHQYLQAMDDLLFAIGKYLKI